MHAGRRQFLASVGLAGLSLIAGLPACAADSAAGLKPMTDGARPIDEPFGQI